MTREDIELFIKVQTQMEELYNEISILSKKSQNDALSEFKLQFVNNLLELSHKILGEKYKPFEEFSVFDAEKLPTNSDAVMILSQYLACFENMRMDNIKDDTFGIWYWVIDNKISDIRTGRPKRLY
jgi:hypothetical protein